jgi:hypothetical protein
MVTGARPFAPGDASAARANHVAGMHLSNTLVESQLRMIDAGGRGSRRLRTGSNRDVARVRNCHWRAGASPGHDWPYTLAPGGCERVPRERKSSEIPVAPVYVQADSIVGGG